MGLFSANKPYTAISRTIEHMTSQKSALNDGAQLLELIELIQIHPQDGTAEAGRAIRKRIKYGDPKEQVYALTLAESLVDNGGNDMDPMVTNSGLLEQVQTTSKSGPDRPRRHAAHLLQHWSRRKGLASALGNSNRSSGSRRMSGSRYREDEAPALSTRPSGSRRYDDDNNDDDRYRSQERARSRGRSPSRERRRRRSPSRSPTPLNLRGQSIESMIATGHSVSTRLTNSIILHDGATGREATGYYKQAKQLRRRVLQLITEERPEVAEYLEQLLKVNEEIIASIQTYDDHAGAVSEDELVPVRPAPERRASPDAPPRPSRRRSPSPPVTPPMRPTRGLADDPFADVNEVDDAPQHTPLW